MAVLAAIAGVVFWFTVRNLDAQEDQLNNLSPGHFETADNETTKL